MKLSVNEAKLTGLQCRIQALMGGGVGGRGGLQKIFFQPFWPQFCLKIRWRGRGAGLPWIRHWVFEQSARNCATIQQVLILKFAFGPEKFPGL